MSSRSKEKMAAAFRKIFRPSQKIGDHEGAAGGSSSGGGGSPARRLLSRSYHRDAVTPADASNGLDSPSPAARRSVTDIFRKKASSASADKGVGSSGSHKTVRARRLMKELREIQRIQQQHRNDPIFSVELINDNLFEWHVRLHRVDSESDLAADMRELDVPFILLHLVFPDNFPFAPPFMRVISPRVEKGFVMEGGAICMELLTPRGWASAYTVEAVIMQFAASIVKGQGRIARKQKGSKDFSRRSAEESFRSLVKTHEKYGWVTPPLADG